jgi:hypothetical protein
MIRLGDVIISHIGQRRKQKIYENDTMNFLFEIGVDKEVRKLSMKHFLVGILGTRSRE